MADKKSRSDRIDELEERLERIEEHHESCGDAGDDTGDLEDARCCAVPEVAERTFDANVSEARAEAIRTISKKWANGTVLRYYFLTNRLDGGTNDRKHKRNRSHLSTANELSYKSKWHKPI